MFGAVEGARTVSTCFIVAWVRNVARLMSRALGAADWRDGLAAGVEAETCDNLSRKEQIHPVSVQRRWGVLVPVLSFWGHYWGFVAPLWPPNATSQLERN
ncbi:hypothetical protein PGQ11_013809 [Apiospora arundinis]|uniref:Secreted protein n=1 Tax=Apiospora arundinis TaxID=335852 RepID=A0ABR2HQG5_9PEZI